MTHMPSNRPPRPLPPASPLPPAARPPAPRHRRSCWLALGVSAVLATGCGPVPVAFDVPFEASGTVEGAGLLEQLIGQLGFDELTAFDLSSSQEFENHNARKEDVTDVRLTALTLTATAPEGATLDFLDTIAFHAEAPGESQVQVASASIGDGVSEVALTLEDVNLAPYVRADTMTLSTEATGRRPAEDTTLLIEANFHVIAEVDGADLAALAGR